MSKVELIIEKEILRATWGLGVSDFEAAYGESNEVFEEALKKQCRRFVEKLGAEEFSSSVVIDGLDPESEVKVRQYDYDIEDYTVVGTTTFDELITLMGLIFNSLHGRETPFKYRLGDPSFEFLKEAVVYENTAYERWKEERRRRRDGEDV